MKSLEILNNGIPDERVPFASSRREDSDRGRGCILESVGDERHDKRKKLTDTPMLMSEREGAVNFSTAPISCSGASRGASKIAERRYGALRRESHKRRYTREGGKTNDRGRTASISEKEDRERERETRLGNDTSWDCSEMQRRAKSSVDLPRPLVVVPPLLTISYVGASRMHARRSRLKSRAQRRTIRAERIYRRIRE